MLDYLECYNVLFVLKIRFLYVQSSAAKVNLHSDNLSEEVHVHSVHSEFVLK